MRITSKFAVRTMAVTALIGAFGATGTAVASADTFTELDPRYHDGTLCMVVDDNDKPQFFSTRVDCALAQSEIDFEQRREDRREERLEEAADAREQRLQDARDGTAASRPSPGGQVRFSTGSAVFSSGWIVAGKAGSGSYGSDNDVAIV